MPDMVVLMEPTSRLIRLREVRQRTGVSTTTIYNMINKGTFPPSVSLGAKMKEWLGSEVEAWITSR